MVNTILFDYDGTLMDTNEVVLQSWQHTFRTLRGCEEEPEVIRRTFGEPLVMTLAKLFPETPVEKSLDIYRSFQREVFT
ncbi:MAG: HAD hydrolase-like protein, partial [Firmicutes bacterium]|nr:HAD hydrolase-like protein [Bacillota bacterium]